MSAKENEEHTSSFQLYNDTNHNNNMLLDFTLGDSLPIGALLAEQFDGEEEDADRDVVSLHDPGCHSTAPSSWDPSVLASCMPDPIIEPYGFGTMTTLRSVEHEFPSSLFHPNNANNEVLGSDAIGTTTTTTIENENSDEFGMNQSFSTTSPTAPSSYSSPLFSHDLFSGSAIGGEMSKNHFLSTSIHHSTTTASSASFAPFGGKNSSGFCNMMMRLNESSSSPETQQRGQQEQQRFQHQQPWALSALSPVEQHRKQMIIMQEQQRTLLEKMNQDMQVHSSSQQLYMQLEQRLEKIQEVGARDHDSVSSCSAKMTSLCGHGQGSPQGGSSFCPSCFDPRKPNNHMFLQHSGDDPKQTIQANSTATATSPSTSFFTSAGTGLTIREGGWLLGLESLNLPAARPKRKRRPKAKDAPKRPLSAYNLFFKDQRAKMLESMEASTTSSEDSSSSSSDDQPWRWDDLSGKVRDEDDHQPARKKQKSRGLGFASLARTIAAKWKDIDEETLERYQQRAEREMELYKEAVREYEERKKQEEKSGQQQ